MDGAARGRCSAGLREARLCDKLAPVSPRSSVDRAPASGAGGARSNRAGGTDARGVARKAPVQWWELCYFSTHDRVRATAFFQSL